MMTECYMVGVVVQHDIDTIFEQEDNDDLKPAYYTLEKTITPKDIRKSTGREDADGTGGTILCGWGMGDDEISHQNYGVSRIRHRKHSYRL